MKNHLFFCSILLFTLRRASLQSKNNLCDVEETTCTTNSFVALPRLHATAVDCAHELINGKSGIKGEAGKVLQN